MNDHFRVGRRDHEGTTVQLGHLHFDLARGEHDARTIAARWLRCAVLQSHARVAG
jgi:hypothetical protein